MGIWVIYMVVWVIWDLGYMAGDLPLHLQILRRSSSQMLYQKF